MKSVAIIQARMTSTRLPGKVMMDICGKPSITRMVERIKRARKVDHIIVATTTNYQDDPLVDLCKQLNIEIYRGVEHDVLDRFYKASLLNDADVILRLTADCPMIDPGVIDDILSMFYAGGYDYVSNCNDRTFPDGLDVEAFKPECLERANFEATHPFAREHVTPYIRGTRKDCGDGDFVKGQVTYAADFSHIRWTLDTLEDLERIRELVALLPEDYTWLEALAVATKYPWLLGVTDVERKVA